MKQFSFTEDISLYKHKVAYSDISGILNSLFSDDIEEFKVQIIIYDGNLIEALNNLSEGNGSISKRDLLISDNFSSYEIDGKFGRKKDIEIGGKLLVVRHPKFSIVWLCISNYGSKFFNYPFKFLMQRIRPRIFKPIITTPQFEELFFSFQQSNLPHNIRVIQIGQRSKITSKGAKRYIESDRKWTDQNLKEVFYKANVFSVQN